MEHLSHDRKETNPTSTQRFPFHFRGDASEYFGIWFVNYTLTMLTLGIYSAWAKVRNLQYFYGKTELAGGAFQFTASPWKILRSRLFAFALLVVYSIVEQLESEAAVYAYTGFILAFILLAPILTVFVLTFRLSHSSWRGIAFHFNKNYREAYHVYLLPNVLLILAFGALWLPFNSPEVDAFLGYTPYQEAQINPPVEETPTEELLVEEPMIDDVLADEEEDGSYINNYLFIPSAALLLLFVALLPYFDFINGRFIARNASFGTSRFSYSASAADYYAIYWPWFAVTLLVLALWFLALATNYIDFDGNYLTLGLVSLLYYSGTMAYFKSRRYNLLLGKMTTDHGRIRLMAKVPFLGLLLLLAVNSMVVTLTLGLMGPWARVRTTRFLLQHTDLLASTSLDQFVARQTEEQDAIGEEIVDAFGLEIVG